MNSFKSKFKHGKKTKLPWHHNFEEGQNCHVHSLLVGPGHLAPGRADYEQAFNGLNLITEKISGTLFEISGALAKALATP